MWISGRMRCKLPRDNRRGRYADICCILRASVYTFGTVEEGLILESIDSPRRVYFIEAVGLDLIKIGFALRLSERIAELQTASPVPLRLLGSVLGGRDLERFYHDCFADQRVKGEWFRRCPELDRYIEAADKPYVPSPAAQAAIDREKRYAAYRMRRENGRKEATP